jgi:hypothetical protein
MRARPFIAVLIVAGFTLSACGEVAKKTDTADEPAQLVEVDGSDQPAIVLTADAAERLAVETATATAAPKPGQTIIPHAAVFYGLDGDAWTYTSPEALTYVREPITIDRIDGERAYLTAGPAPGTEVVTVGAPELFGVEEGVGH